MIFIVAVWRRHVEHVKVAEEPAATSPPAARWRARAHQRHPRHLQKSFAIVKAMEVLY